MGRYMVVLGLYYLVLLSITWNWVSTRLLCLNILKKVLIWSDVTIEERTDKQTNKQGKIELLSQWTMDRWDEQQGNITKEKCDITVVKIHLDCPLIICDLSENLSYRKFKVGVPNPHNVWVLHHRGTRSIEEFENVKMFLFNQINY